MPFSWFKKGLLFTVLIGLLGACTPPSIETTELQEKYSYQAPPYLDDGWQVGHLADYGFNPAPIVELVQDIEQQKYPGIDSITLVKNRTLLLHENLRHQFSEFDQWIDNQDLNRHLMHSTSKSFISALTGIAIQQGFLQSTEQPVLDLFNYGQYENWNDRKQQMTIDDVLTMRLGLEWDEWNYQHGDPRNSLSSIASHNKDYVKALFDRNMVDAPGQTFAYNTVASIALGSVIEQLTGMELEDYAQMFLFEPLQISDVKWLETPNGLANGGSGLFLQTRDMAKLGQLYLDGGVWNGIRIIEQSWVEQSLSAHVPLSWEYTTGYGYQWWLGDFVVNQDKISFFSTRGSGGQFIVVIPQYELVIAFTAHNYDNNLYQLPFQLIEQFILPALVVSA